MSVRVTTFLAAALFAFAQLAAVAALAAETEHGSEDDAQEMVREAVDLMWLPRLHAFKPEMIFVSAGFDAHREDDLGNMGLVEDDYAWLTTQIRDIADRYAKGRIVSTLEGGYNLSALGRSVVAHVRALAGI